MVREAPELRTLAQPPEALRLALDAIQDLKGNHLVVLDLRGLNDATDFSSSLPERRTLTCAALRSRSWKSCTGVDTTRTTWKA